MVFEQVGLALTELSTSSVAIFPNIVGAIILLVIGLVIGKVVGRIVFEVLGKIKLDYYISETHKPAVSLSSVFSLIARWWIYLAFIAAAVGVLRIPELSLFTIQIMGYIPSVIGAAAIIIASYILAEYIKNQLRQTNKVWAAITGKVVMFFILYVAIALALPVLGINALLVNNILLIIIAAVGLGVALALGLGLKDAISDVSKRYAQKLKV
jgi:hypothetical protein